MGLPNLVIPQGRRSATWQANTFYSAGEVVVNGGVAYAALADFTSGSVFNEANWACLSSGQEIFYSANVTGTTLALGSTLPTAAGTSLLCSGLVPQSTRPIWLYAEAFADVTTAPAAGGTGNVNLLVYDDQGTPVMADGSGIEPFESGSGTSGYARCAYSARIAPNTTSRTYTLYAYRTGDSTFRASILNGANAPVYRSYLRAAYA